MTPTLNSAKLSILWSNLITDGIDRDVVNYAEGGTFELFFGLSIDVSLFDQGFLFVANFQIEEVRSGQLFNHYWEGDFDSLPHAGGIWLRTAFTSAAAAGARNAPVSYFGTNKGDGMYLFRPSFAVIAFVSGDPGYTTGASEYAVAEEHFFLVESGL